jgi:hypothetical protein
MNENWKIQREELFTQHIDPGFMEAFFEYFFEGKTEKLLALQDERQVIKKLCPKQSDTKEIEAKA